MYQHHIAHMNLLNRNSETCFCTKISKNTVNIITVNQELILLLCVDGDPFSSQVSMAVVVLSFLKAFDKCKVGLISQHALLYSICLLHSTNPIKESWKSVF